MEDHPIKELIETSMGKIREMGTVDTTIGDPITAPDGSVIIPVCKVSFGFASGGSDFPSKTPKDMFGGGSGGGVTIIPLAFLVLTDGKAKLLQLSKKPDTNDKLVGMIPDVVNAIVDLIKDKKGKGKDKNPKECDINISDDITLEEIDPE